MGSVFLHQTIRVTFLRIADLATVNLRAVLRAFKVVLDGDTLRCAFFQLLVKPRWLCTLFLTEKAACARSTTAPGGSVGSLGSGVIRPDVTLFLIHIVERSQVLALEL